MNAHVLAELKRHLPAHLGMEALEQFAAAFGVDRIQHQGDGARMFIAEGQRQAIHVRGRHFPQGRHWIALNRGLVRQGRLSLFRFRGSGGRRFLGFGGRVLFGRRFRVSRCLCRLGWRHNAGRQLLAKDLVEVVEQFVDDLSRRRRLTKPFHVAAQAPLDASHRGA